MNMCVESWCEIDEHYRYDLFTDFNEWLEGESEEAQEIREKYGLDALADPSKALFAGDRKEYDQKLEEYRTKRYHEALNEAFFSEKFGDDHWFERNLEHFNQLVERLEAGDVVPFIGAGISKAGGFPTWEEHLRTQGRTAGLGAERVEELLASGAYEKVIELIECERGREVFEQEIRDAFSRTGSLTETIFLVTELFTDTVITTNYDRLLEQAYDTGAQNTYEVINCFKEMRNPNVQSTSIFKLHGDISTPTHCILGKNQYDEAYGNDEIDMTLPIPKRLEYYYKNNSLLFLGSSLHNDRTVHVFRAIRDKLHGAGDTYIPQHFCIEQAPQTEEEVTERNAYLVRLGITPIWFEPERYEFVESILRMARNELRYRQKDIRSKTMEPISVEKPPCNLDIELNEFINDFVELMPLMYWLHRHVPQKDTERYLQSIQRVFYAGSFFIDDIDEDLVIGLDNLTRALSNKPKFDGYTYEKLLAAFKSFQKYFQSIGKSSHASDNFKWSIHDLLTIPYTQFNDSELTITNPNYHISRLAMVLLEHGKNQRHNPKNYAELPEALNAEMTDYLTTILKSKLGLEIPDRLQNGHTNQIKDLCKNAWNHQSDLHGESFLKKVKRCFGKA